LSTRPVLVLDSLALAADGRSLSLEMFAGESYAVMGPSGSCKAKLLDVLIGRSKAVSGRVFFNKPAAKPASREFGRRLTPNTIARGLAKRASNSRLTTVLSALGLWDVRHATVNTLDQAQLAACELLPVFFPENALALIDGHLDTLDPWARETAIALLQDQRRDGCAFVVSTNLTTVATSLGNLIVYSGSSPVYAGPVADLIRSTLPSELVIETDDPSTVATMVEPFALSVRQTEHGLIVQADKGQEIAARLLTLGYGKVRSVLLREPTLAEALRHLA
jgi:ABC-type multidrug transport system ATPase subunit